MKRLRLSADYSCWPLWHDDSATTDEWGDIDPRTLPIPAALAEELIVWSDWFDRGLNMDDPASSCWAPGEREEFERVGEELLVRLRAALGPGYTVRRGGA